MCFTVEGGLVSAIDHVPLTNFKSTEFFIRLNYFSYKANTLLYPLFSPECWAFFYKSNQILKKTTSDCFNILKFTTDFCTCGHKKTTINTLIPVSLVFLTLLFSHTHSHKTTTLACAIFYL